MVSQVSHFFSLGILFSTIVRVAVVAGLVIFFINEFASTIGINVLINSSYTSFSFTSLSITSLIFLKNSTRKGFNLSTSD